MQEADRKLAWAAVAVLSVVALELGWFLLVGAASHNGHRTPNPELNYWEWAISAAFWTAVFTGVLTWSTIRLWKETRRLAEGADDQSQKMERSIQQAKRMALATMVAARAARKSAAVAEKALYVLERSRIEIAKITYDGELNVRMRNYGRTAGTPHYVMIKAVAMPWDMQNKLRLGEHEERLETPNLIAANGDDVFSTRFLQENFRTIEPNLATGVYALRVHVKYRVSGALEEWEEAGSWFVFDFRNRTFLAGFNLPNFDSTKPIKP